MRNLIEVMKHTYWKKVVVHLDGLEESSKRSNITERSTDPKAIANHTLVDSSQHAIHILREKIFQVSIEVF